MREKIIDCFNEYIRGFDNSDPMIILKKEHTYRVANLSEKIARSISDIYDLSEGDVDLACFMILGDLNNLNDMVLLEMLIRLIMLSLEQTYYLIQIEMRD